MTRINLNKHTIGPWSVSEEDTFGINCVAIMGAHDEPVAHVETWADDEEPSKTEARANAELIAAAPRFLNALKEIIEICDQTYARSYRKVDAIANVAQKALVFKP